jgi:hypothetical protein
MEKPVTIMITRLERDLILRYGYPFEDIEKQLTEGEKWTSCALRIHPSGGNR